MKVLKKIKGLSLIEIIIAISIIGLLSFFLYLPIITQLKKARDGKRKIDINLIQKGLEEYYDSTNCYPERLPECGNVFSVGSTNILAGIPCDPKNNSFYPYITTGENCSPYFKLYAKLERSEDPNIYMTGCENGCGPNCAYNFGVSSSNVSLDYCEPPITPNPTTVPPSPTSLTPSPTPIQYVCGPASGPNPEGQCEAYAVPTLSECPKIYPNDSTCEYECYIRDNRCKNAKGKFKQ
ncbi:MAG: prepilin-type N-terminal cleavage/methylation domain-containing protein [Patescibacteria group bacterium]|jgi:prepilin-type N-terminal cleavage/methylation domain-containing protein